MQSSIKWYQEVLGCSVAKKINFGDGQITFMKLGDFYIELFAMPNSKPPVDFETEMGQDLTVQGTKHMAFVVNDLREFVERLKKQGIKYFAPGVPGRATEEDNPRAIFLRDNSGILLEFVPPSAPE
jgi:catechol 2,3-dioxygenase-like lactoylglutathione lyase family enzyme